MLYKMIYFSSHKFAFSNLRFSPFYEHFRQLREKYALKLEIKYIMLISSLSPIWWCPYIWLFLKKPLDPLHSTELFKIFFSLLTLSTAFLQKACGPGKNSPDYKVFIVACWHLDTFVYRWGCFRTKYNFRYFIRGQWSYSYANCEL